MLFDLFVKFWLTPENILGLLWNIIMIVGMCLIFCAWQEKWWKSLIPFYGTYIVYKHTWQKQKWLFLVQIFFDVLGAKCLSGAKKHLTTNLLYTIRTYIETEQLDVDISVPRLVICIILFLISAVITFILTRVTYMKVCSSLQIENLLLKIGTFFLPQIFLVVDYICYKNADKGNSPVAERETGK